MANGCPPETTQTPATSTIHCVDENSRHVYIVNLIFFFFEGFRVSVPLFVDNDLAT